MNELKQNICKAARALLEWTQMDLSEKSGVNIGSVRSYESKRNSLLSRDNEKKVRQTLEQAGIQFIAENDEGVGVRFKPSGGE